MSQIYGIGETSGLVIDKSTVTMNNSHFKDSN